MLTYGEIDLHPKRVSNIKLFINEYKWKGIHYPSKTLEKNNRTIAINIFILKKEK